MSAIVSVVMPSVNSARHISDALHSVINQSLKEFEIIVVDGGSTDGTRDIVTMLANSDSRIRLITNDDDQGPAHARCVGIRAAKGDYVAFLDADDFWLPSKLEAQVSFMRATGTSFSYTRFRHVSENGVAVGCLVPMRHSYRFEDVLTVRKPHCKMFSLC